HSAFFFRAFASSAPSLSNFAPIVLLSGSLRDSAKAVKVLLPIICLDGSVGNRITAVNHHPIAHINSHMRSARCVVGSLEENQISWFRFGRWDNITEIFKPVRSLSADTPAIAAVIDNPADESGTVKAG